MANLNLASFTSEAMATGKPEVWSKVLEKLKAGKMPPPGQPVPPKSDVTPVTGWIEGVLAQANGGSGKDAGASKDPDPGRVTARISGSVPAEELKTSASAFMHMLADCCYFPLQQLLLQPSQQCCVHPSGQQLVQQPALACFVCVVWPNATAVSASMSER